MADKGLDTQPPAAELVFLPELAVPAVGQTTAEGSQGTPARNTTSKRKRRWPFARVNDAPERLTEDEIRERLCLNSNGLIDEVHAFVAREVQVEEQRETRLDAKATAMAAAAGFSVTVVFSVGMFLLEKIKVVEQLGPVMGRGVLALYWSALLFGLLASAWALRALRVRNTYRSVKDNDVFSVKEFDRIEEVAKEAEDPDKKAQSEYRRYMLPQQWMFLRSHQRIHDEKADLISRGQWFFGAFIFTLLAVGGVITVSAFLEFST